MAFEVLRNASNASVKSDVWSFGGIIFYLLTKNKEKFGDLSQEELKSEIEKLRNEKSEYFIPLLKICLV